MKGCVLPLFPSPTPPLHPSALMHTSSAGPVVKGCVHAFPSLELSAQLQPITRTVLRIQLAIRPTFEWRDRQHGGSVRWHIWVEDGQNEHIYHNEVRVCVRGEGREKGEARRGRGRSLNLNAPQYRFCCDGARVG